MTGDTTTATTAPEIGQPRALPAQPEPEGIAVLRAERDAAEPKKHSLRRVTVHGTAASAVGGLATLAHIAGPAAAGATGLGAALVASGAVAYSKRKPGPRRSRRSRIRSGRTRTATSRSATARRSGATKGATTGRGATVRRRSIRATPTGATAATRRSATSRRATGGSATRMRRTVRRHFGRPVATGSRATRPGVRHGRRHGGLTPSPAGTRATRSGARRGTAAASTRRARVAARTAPVRRTARRATRRAVRGWRGGVAIGKKYTRFTDPAHSPRHAAPKQGAAAKKAPATKTAKTAPGKPIKPPGNPAAKKTAPKAPQKKAAPKTAAKPGAPITAPGQQKASTPVTTTETQALTEAIQQNIGGFEPKHALDVEAFLVGLNETFSELSNSLSIAAERLRGDFPIEASVTDLIDQMGVQAATLTEYAQEGHRVFRLAHAADLERHENPRPQEEAWDISTRE